MNYRPLVLNKFKEFSKDFTEYTFGQLVHSILTKMEDKPSNSKMGWLLELKDDEVYTAIEKSIEFEKE